MAERRRLPSRRRRHWSWLFGDRGQRVAVIEQQADGSFRAIVGGTHVRTFTSETAAKLFVEKLRDTDAEDGAQ